MLTSYMYLFSTVAGYLTSLQTPHCMQHMATIGHARDRLVD